MMIYMAMYKDASMLPFAINKVIYSTMIPRQKVADYRNISWIISKIKFLMISAQ